MYLDNTVAAIVTGGASGLSRATAEALAAHGARVTIFDMNAELGHMVAANLGGAFCKVDVTSDSDVDAGLAAARALHGQERILVNCAGIGNAIKTVSRSQSTGALRHFPIEAFEKIIQVNLIGSFRCIAKSAVGMATLAPLADGEKGAIVTTSSIAAEEGQVGQAAYAASKAGIVGMTLPIARDLMSEGIRINTILPGTFLTPLLETAGTQVIDALAASIPFPRRLGQPQEFGRLVIEIVRNTYINGTGIRLDGALRMPPK